MPIHKLLPGWLLIGFSAVLLAACQQEALRADQAPTTAGGATPPQVTAPTVQIGAAPATVVSGQVSALTWSSTNAISCTASGGWSGAQSTSGSAQVAPSSTTAYALNCSGAGGSATGNVTVTVTQPAGAPTVSLSAQPAAIFAGQNATLIWTSTNATSCGASGGWSGSRATSGSLAVAPSADTTYVLSCSGTGGTAAASFTVTVTATVPPVAATLYVSPSGSDTNPGTAAQPFATPQKASSVASAGDVVSIAAGSYVGFTISRSGTSSLPLVFRANGTVTLSRNSSGYGIYIDNSSYITLEGFTISGINGKGIAARGATPSSPMRGLTIRNNTISDTQQEGMYLSQVSNSLIENNRLTNVGMAGVVETGHGIYLANSGSKNTTIRGNTFTAPGNNWGEALHVNGDESVGGDGLITGLVFENNRILGGFNNGMSLDGVQNSDIRNNIIVDINHHGIRAYRIDGAAGPTALRIVNNTIRASAGNAVKTSEDVGSSIVFNNILYGGDGSTLFGVSAVTAANLATFAADAISFAPTSAAVGTGITSLSGVLAPTTDINGNTRGNPPGIGALE